MSSRSTLYCFARVIVTVTLWYFAVQKLSWTTVNEFYFTAQWAQREPPNYEWVFDPYYYNTGEGNEGHPRTSSENGAPREERGTGGMVDSRRRRWEHGSHATWLWSVSRVSSGWGYRLGGKWISDSHSNLCLCSHAEGHKYNPNC